jgi:hypothetical protein
MIDYGRTIISQYGASLTLQEIIEDMNEAIDPRVNIQAFYDAVWNVNTAFGRGLDLWGKIVGVSRLLRIPGNLNTFGFKNDSIPNDWRPFGHGTFYTGTSSSQTYFLPDDVYRTLILTQALANIVRTTSSAINALLRNLFPGRGRCYVIDAGSMTMRFVFEFELSLVEYAILTQSGVLPHPTGVRYSITVIPAGGTFGFAEGGALPFNDGTFNMPAPF